MDSTISSSKNHYLTIFPILYHTESLFTNPLIFTSRFFIPKFFTRKLNFSRNKRNCARSELNLLLIQYLKNFYAIFARSFSSVFCFYFFAKV
jgi:hypothetical protein